MSGCIFEVSWLYWLFLSGVNKVNDSVLSLNTTTQSFHGVELSKDQRGITLNMPFTNTTVFFDGNTAHVKGTKGWNLSQELYLCFLGSELIDLSLIVSWPRPVLEPVPPVEGLCGNSTNFSQTTTLSAAISTSYSFDGYISVTTEPIHWLILRVQSRCLGFQYNMLSCFSPSSCEIQYNDTDNSTVNCNDSTEQ